MELGKKPHIGVLTTFYEFNSSYSLCSVVESQLVSLVKYGYPTVLFVLDNFKGDDKVPKEVEIRKAVPQFYLTDYANNQEVGKEFEGQVERVYKALKEHTKDIDIIIQHDLIFQGWFLPYAAAIHKFAKESKIKWFHWIHSVPNFPPANLGEPHIFRYRLPENSKLVYLNNFHIIRVAESYGLFPKDVRVVYNPVDPRLFWNLHPLVKSLIEKYDLLSADLIQTYPLSTPRMVSGKGLHTAIDIFSKLKQQNKKVRLIICNAHANAKQEQQLIVDTLLYASQRNLNAGEVIFTSLEDSPLYELGVPREVVSQFFLLSNLFIFPSQSENCSLILLEAMLSKNLLILNDNVPSMREFGKENALYFKFGSIDDRVSYDDKEKFMEDIAKIIISEFSTNKVLRSNAELKQNFSYDTIFKRMIEPLFYEN